MIYILNNLVVIRYIPVLYTWYILYGVYSILYIGIGPKGLIRITVAGVLFVAVEDAAYSRFDLIGLGSGLRLL